MCLPLHPRARRSHRARRESFPASPIPLNATPRRRPCPRARLLPRAGTRSAFQFPSQARGGALVPVNTEAFLVPRGPVVWSRPRVDCFHCFQSAKFHRADWRTRSASSPRSTPPLARAAKAHPPLFCARLPAHPTLTTPLQTPFATEAGQQLQARRAPPTLGAWQRETTRSRRPALHLRARRVSASFD